MFVTAIFSIISVVAATDNLYIKIEQRLNRLARANNVSDDRLMVRELHTFVSDDGFRRRNDDDAALRRDDPLEKELNLKVVDLMRQAIYGTQDRIREMDAVLERYEDDVPLRMRFIFDKLEQLMLDIKRVYTLAVRRRTKKRVFEQVIWYEHCTRKFLDILYTVDLAIDTHVRFMPPVVTGERDTGLGESEMGPGQHDRGPGEHHVSPREHHMGPGEHHRGQRRLGWRL